MTSNSEDTTIFSADSHPMLARLETRLQRLREHKAQQRSTRTSTAAAGNDTAAPHAATTLHGRLVAIEHAGRARNLQLLCPAYDWRPAAIEMVGFTIPAEVRQAQPLSCPQYAAELDDVRVVAGIGAVLDRQAREIISDSVQRQHARLNADWYRKYGMDVIDPANASCFAGGGSVHKVHHAVSLFSWENRNYAHWLIEKLASMRWISMASLPADTVLLVESGLPSSILESLELFWPAERIKLVERGHAVDVEHLFYFSDAAEIWEPRDGYAYLGNDYRICPEAMCWLARVTRSRIPPRDTDSTAIYLIRPPGGNGRAVRNQDALVALLAGRGYSSIQPASLDFAAQVGLFSNLASVVSPSGAALANLLWMPPGSTVVVLSVDVPEAPYWFYHSLAAALGVRLVFFAIEGVEDRNLPPFHWDTDVPLEALAAWLDDADVALPSPSNASTSAQVLPARPIDVTVAVMSYNNAAYLGETVRSVLAQEGVSLEVIIRDDASTDGSIDVLDTFKDDPRVSVEINPHNLGMVANVNRCLESGRGRYVVVLGSDDVMYPGHLVSLISAMDTCPQAALGYTQCDWIDGASVLIRHADHPGHPARSYRGARNEVAELLAFDDYVTPSAMILRRSILERLRQPDGRIHADMPAGDWDLVVRVAELAPDFVFLRQASIGYRVHGNQISAGFYASTAPLDNHIRILEGIFARGSAHRLRGRADDVAALLDARLAQYPSEHATALGHRATALLLQLEALKHGTPSRAADKATPLFTVILTTYNRPELLKDALASLDAQTLRDFEVVLVNDDGIAVEALLEAHDFPLIYLRQPKSRGPAAARNAGLRLASGRHVAYLDDDDIFLPQHLATLAEALEARPGTFVYTEAEYVSERLSDGQRIEQSRSRPFRHEVHDRELLFARNYIPVNTWAHPRDMLNEVGGFDVAFAALEDWDMLLRLAARFPFFHVPGCTVEVRTRSSGAGNDHLSGREHRNFPELYRRIYERHPDTFSPRLQQLRREVIRSVDRGGVASSPAATTLGGWLDRRVPTPLQKARLAAYFDANRPPSIGVVVIDDGGDADAVERTLDSLADERHAAPDIRVAVVTAPDVARPAHELQPDHIACDHDDIARGLNALLEQASFDWFVLVRAGDCFTSAGLDAVAQELISAPDMRAIYADEIMLDETGAIAALLRPGFNLDLLLAMPSSMAGHWLYRRDVVMASGGFDPSFADALEYQLLLRLIAAGGLEGLGHVDEPLLIARAPDVHTRQAEIDALQHHLSRRGYDQAEVTTPLPGCYRINYGHAATPGVSILIPTRNHLGQLRRCLETLLEKTTYSNYEVLIIDNDSTDEDACAWLAGIQAMNSPQLRVLRHSGDHNRSAMLNRAASQARGDYLLLLSADTAVVDGGWLDAMLNHAQRPEVGVVGAKLLRSDGNIDSAGIVLGLREGASTPFAGHRHSDAGYMFRLQVDQNYSAVDGSCLLIRRSIFEETAQGLDADAFAHFYSEVDLCLKVRDAGYLVVWTPHALLMHEAPETHGTTDEEAAERERDSLLERWLPLIARDPAYNRHLTLHGPGFEVDTASTFNWQPLRWRPVPVTLAVAADASGCGHYRVIEPSRAMNDYGLADAHSTRHYPSPIELERLAPDVVILQRQMTAEAISAQMRLARFNHSFKVAELDDYLPELPADSLHRTALPRDIAATMRESLKLVDRFVVSTAPLADALSDMHADIRVVENRLPRRWWGHLSARRRRGKRPRVGWGGGIGHHGDLQMIADVVKTLADEVEWVFLGMCPRSIYPYASETHAGVPIEDYASTLAGLDLDLALAPLEDNLFNRCKSNLRLLEYGACGFPVVCSDIAPYQGNLPVTRVKPNARAWIDAIRMHTHDLDAAAKAGDAMRETVLRDWMLDETHAAFWLSQWLPD